MSRALLLLILATCPSCEEPPPGDVPAGPGDGLGGAFDPSGPINGVGGGWPNGGRAPGDGAPSDAGRFDAAAPRGPCAAGDEDGDGWGTAPACDTPDCDEGNRSIRPGAPEACNGLDDDCDGEIDEDLNVSVCGVGACRRTVENCVMGRPQRCVPGEPAPEACNGADDDCDGEIDEEAAVETCGVGACERRAACDGGAVAACTPGEPAPESCNGADDDCDGDTDEGFRATVHDVPYAELAARHPGCDGGGQRIGPHCNAAMNRWCAARDCTNTGFGPAENSGDRATVVCVRAARIENVPFAVLAQHHPNCNAAPERIGPHCNAAIHRWCAAHGHASGVGPIESGPDFLVVACVDAPAATPVGTRYSTLARFHGGCDGARQRIGPDCNAAINRFCRDRGHASGFGPVENSGDDLAVVCVSP